MAFIIKPSGGGESRAYGGDPPANTQEYKFTLPVFYALLFIHLIKRQT
jgi:hypothetical protein